MSLSVADIYHSPDAFLDGLDKAIEDHVDSVMAEKTVEWEERNAGQVVSGSAFALCTRQAFFRYFAEGEAQAEFPLDAKKKMFLGHVNEAIVIDALRATIEKGLMPGDLHIEQASEPVNTKYEYNGVVFSSTSDIILRVKIEKPGGGPSFEIPIELKNTESNDFMPPQVWWKRFHPHSDHLRQLTQWMYYRKREGHAVPYGLLVYSRRSNYDTKAFVIADLDEYPNLSPVLSKDSRQLLHYTEVESIVKRRMRELSAAVREETPPRFAGFREKGNTDPYTETIPQYRCNTCVFKRVCKETRGVDDES